MDFITVTAKTVKDAILEASLKLETFRDNIEYEVIEEGTTGFLGFGGKKAIIRARKKVAVEDILKEEPKEERKVEKKAEKKEFKREKKEFKRERKEEKKEIEVQKEVVEETVAPVKETVEERHERKVAVLTLEEQQEVKERAEKFLKDVFASIDMEVGVETDYSDEVLNVELSGDDMGILIGKRGQTLDSLQYLTSLVVNKGKSGYTRVKVDTENYRSRRKETLENLAKNIAFKVKRTRRPVFLEPMNPYERRIIHSVLQNDPYVTTHSEGEEPYRKVVVTLKKNNR
ncbi:MAG: RNA-binding cell elongation regulator Jag/EloR [Eubacteriales bacterium]|nr:RNA-binding cell elongation regulator Jag/EloR [Eubacteriales bacterium]